MLLCLRAFFFFTSDINVLYGTLSSFEMLLLNAQGVAVRVRRPTDYNPTLAAALGPNQPSPHLNLAAVGLTQG